jgi:uncharacterized membrane protein HdeD (DUF308 family)
MNEKNTFSILAIIFAGVSLLFFPILFGPAALVMGILAMVKQERLRVLALVLSIVLPILGAIIGFIVGAAAVSSMY